MVRRTRRSERPGLAPRGAFSAPAALSRPASAGLSAAPQQTASALDAELRLIVGEMCDLLGAARSTLYLVDARSGAIEALYTYDAPGGQLFIPRQNELQPGAGLIWQEVSVTLQPRVIADAQNDPIIPNQDRMRELGIVSILEVPLVVGDRAIGMVAVGRQATCPEFNEADLRVARTFARQAALAVENARLHQRAAKQAEQLALVNEVGQRIHAILDPERLLDELAAVITASFHYYYTAICLADGDQLVVRAAHSAALGRDARLIGLTLPVAGPSLAGWVVRHKRALRVADVRTHPEYFSMEGLREAGSALAVPLPGWGGVRGALVVESADSDAFEDGDVTLMTALAGQITVALANAGLYRQAADRAMALAAANTRLAELDQLKSDFLSMVSHELRTPLGLIKGYVGTLLAAGLPLDATTQREFLAVIDEETDKLSELVGNLLDMSRIESGRLRVEPQPADLGALIGAAADLLQKRFPGRRVQMDLAPDLPEAWLDPRRIGQVLANLLENAARYAPAASPIVVRARPEGKEIRVTVRDHGPGIAPADRALIFEKFYRGPVGARLEGGAGLGLPIARSLVAAHGGRIWLESPPDGGAAFHFTVPIAPFLAPG